MEITEMSNILQMEKKKEKGMTREDQQPSAVSVLAKTDMWRLVRRIFGFM